MSPFTVAPRACRLLAVLAGALALPVGPSMADDALIAKGEYLGIAADCTSCHTREGGQPFEGGLAIESPLGTMYSANITPDPQYGIGGWTEEEFRRALHEGRNEEGQYIYPSMPYTAYTLISDDDVGALWAWVQSLEPSTYVPPDNEMIFPANIRQGMAVWQAVEFDPGRFEPDPDRDAQYNRGAYLVEALGHCSSCHTPRDLLFGEDADRAYTGAEIHGWYAPAIGPGRLSDIGDWSVEELATFLATGTNDTNQKVVGEMAAVVHESLSKLEPEDVFAMARYLKEMPPAAEQPSVTDTAALSSAQLEAGRSLYADNCLSCHQADGHGIDGGVPSLVDNGTVSGRVADDLIMMMLQGHPADGTWAAMPSFANTLSSEDMAHIANYTRTAWGNGAAPDVTPGQVNAQRELAELPPGGRQAGLDCPALPGAVLAPALELDADVFDAARSSAQRADELVSDYRALRTDSSVEDTVLALSTAYCRSLAGQEGLSTAVQQSRVAALAGRVAEAAGAVKR